MRGLRDTVIGALILCALCGCAWVAPHAAQAIEEGAGFEAVMIALGADIEVILSSLSWLIGLVGW